MFVLRTKIYKNGWQFVTKKVPLSILKISLNTFNHIDAELHENENTASQSPTLKAGMRYHSSVDISSIFIYP